MKKHLLFAFLTNFLLSAYSYAQKQNTTCYERYIKVFEVMHVNEVEDGEHDNIIITIRKRGFADCFVGKVSVRESKIDKSSILINNGNDDYEPLYRSYKSDLPVTIKNGVSSTLYTKDDELINILFVEAIETTNN